MRLLAKARAARRRRRKEAAELNFWRRRAEGEGGTLGTPPVQVCFCDFFGLDSGFYAGKRILDVGCGPRGTLEWADMAAERVGLDPLADSYRELGTERHTMTYVTAPAERMPFPDAHFDVVSTFNSLDHVDDLDAAVAEIARVTRPGGSWLVAVEADAPATATEPQTIPWTFLETLSGWRVESSRRIALRADHDVYGSWAEGREWTGGAGLLVGRLERLAVG